MNQFLSITLSAESIIRALSWTLVHSLWLGMILSLLAGAILLFTKKATPLLRYNLLASTLVFFIIGVVVTFINLLLSSARTVEPTVVQVSPVHVDELPADFLTVKSNSSVITQAVDLVNGNADWIAFAWLLIVACKFIWLSFGLYNMYQLKRKQVFSVGEYWNNRVTELCLQLGVNKKVTLLQSGIIRIPAVIGYFKPIILFPAAMLTSMPVKEVEAILIHELGHIRRRDFLVNFLQNMIEIIFFFNPAILWVSSLIKEERENCCDEIAVAHAQNKQDYINALISFHELSIPAKQQLAIAFSGEENHLLNRVKRIIYYNNKTLSNLEKIFLSAGLVLVSLCLFAFVSSRTQTEIKSKLSASISSKDISSSDNVQLAIDAPWVYKIPGKNKLITGVTNTSIDDRLYTIIIKNAVVTELYIDGKKITAEKIIEYKSALDKIFEEKYGQEQVMKESEQPIRESEQLMKDSVPVYQLRIKNNLTGQTNTIINGEEYKIVLINSGVTALYIGGQKIASENIINYKHAIDSIYNRFSELHPVSAVTPVSPVIESEKKSNKQVLKEAEQARINEDHAKVAAKEAKIEEEKFTKMLKELIEDKIITSSENMSFLLSENKFIVNYKQQPTDIVKRYFAKYGYKGFIRYYNFRMY